MRSGVQWDRTRAMPFCLRSARSYLLLEAAGSSSFFLKKPIAAAISFVWRAGMPQAVESDRSAHTSG